MYDVLIIGSGNVAFSLYKIFKASGVKCAIAARSYDKALEITMSRDNLYGLNDIPQSKFIFLTVKDSVIREVALAIAPQVRANTIVCHTAGSMPLDTIPEEISHRGVFYPLQTFSKGRDQDIVKFTIFVEASDGQTLSELKQLALRVAPKVEELDSKGREMMHIAAVFVSNFTNYMYIAANDIMQECGVDFSHMKPLIEESSTKVCLSILPPEYMQTGPAMRGDKEVIKKHIDLLKDSNIKEIYSTLSSAIENRCNEEF